MAQEYSLGGGAGRLIVPEPDPLQLRLRQAELDALQQKPAIERGQLALQQWEAAQRGQIAAGQHELGVGQLGLDERKLAATLPIEQGKLTAEQQRVAGEDRYRTGSLNEEIRAHNASAAAEAARTNAGLIADMLTHVTPQEGVPGSGVAKGTTEAAMTALGFPQLTAAMKDARTRDATTRAILYATQNKTLDEKKFGALTAGQTDPVFVNAAWNQYKTLHPEVYGKDVATAAETALKPPELTTTVAPTTTGSALTNAYVAPGAGSPSVGWAMGPDSPVASATPGVSQFGPKNPQMGLVDPTTSDVLPLPGGTIASTGAPPPVTPPPSTDQLIKTATAPQVAPVVAGTPPPAAPPPPPQPAITTNALSFNGQPLPISLGISTGQSEQARELEAERKRQALAVMQGGR